jgi:hypothetical protein
MVDRGQTFNVGQTVTVLTDDGFLFVGQIVDCRVKLKCDCCDERGKDKCDDDKHKDNVECDTFIKLELEEDVEVGGPPGPSVVAFQEGQIVLINFCQIIAIAPGFPPVKGEGA